MKRFSKILVAVMALCLLVGVLALAISANSGIDGKFVVKGEGYDTWGEAVEAAANTHTIYLNEDWTLDTGLTLSGETTNVKVNLNGNTVSVTDGSMLFNVYTNAKLTIEGVGTLVNNGEVLIGGSNYGEVTVNATGAGIVINNNATSGDVNTFRFTTYSTLNVSGKIVVNTNTVTNSRAFINVYDNAAKTVKLDITDADILYATPTVDGTPSAKFIYSGFSDINIENSRLEAVDAYLLYSVTTGGKIDITAYLKDLDAASTINMVWDPEKLAEAKSTIVINTKENITAKDSVFYSTKVRDISGNLMYFGGATEGNFTNCEFYGYYRAFAGPLGNNNFTDATNYAHATELTFNDCHFRASSGSIASLFSYAPNYKIFGGSVSGVSSLGNCHMHYIELDNGGWIGGYIDNVLGVSGLKGDDTAIISAWQNAAIWNTDSTILGTLPKSVTIVVSGESKTFTTGYFSDMDKYNSYLPANSVWNDYIYGMTNGDTVTATGDFTKVGASAAVGTNPLSVSQKGAFVFAANTDKGVVSSVLSPNGNGYVKFYWDGTTYSGNTGSSNYAYVQTPTGAAGSIVTNDMFVIEFDIATENGAYTKTSFTTQGRGKQPRFDANGTYLGYSNAGLQISAMDYSPNPQFTFNGTTLTFGKESYTLPVATGDWTRVTIVYDFDISELQQNIDIPVHAKNGSVNSSNKEIFDLVADTYVKKNAYQVLKYDMLVYLNGEYFDTVAIEPKTVGINGYIVEGYEANYYIDGIRIGQSATAGREDSWCVDNVRVSTYPNSANVDLGLYKDGAPVESLEGLPHFLIMPDNNAVEETYVANVDGVNYATESEAFAAITEGSVVELLADLESCVPANVAFKLITNGYSVPGFVSATHKVVDSVAGMGWYDIVAASADEIFTINYSFGGKTATQTVAMGTVVPAVTETFPTTIEGNTVTFVESWTLPANISDYALTSNVINATAVTDTKNVVAVAGGVGYDSLESAIAGANGATIVLYDNVTVDEMILIDALNVVLDLNGKTVTAGQAAETIFNVRYGSNFTLKGTGTIDNALTVIGASNLGSTDSVVNVNADAASGSTGIVINHRTIEDGADTSTSISTFRIHDSAILNVSGLITVNAYNGQRVVFNVYAGSGTVAAKALNISKAKVVVPLLGRTPDNGTPKGYSQVISAGDGTAININDSELYALYGQLFHINGGSSTKNVSAYMNADFTWLDNAASSISIDAATVTINARNSRFFSEFGSYSQAMHASGHNPGASFMSLAARLDAKFENCTITTDWRGITDNSGISNKKINNNQLLFLDCDFVTAPKTGSTANAAVQFFMYGCNYKVIGGTWAHGSMSAGSNYYLPLTDASGNLTGQWIGGYMDGVLVDSAKTHAYSGVTSNWSDSTYVERSAIACNIVRVTDGVARTFKAAYFGNISEYLNTVKAYEGLAVYYNNGNEATPFTNFAVGTVNGTVTKVDGYVKHYFEASAGIKGYNNLDGNPGTVTYATTGAYIWEFDVSTDDGYFATTDINIEARDKHAIFGENGAYLGYANSAGAVGSLNYEATQSLTIAADYAKFNGKSVKISTEKGDLTRITFIFNVVLGEERTESVPAYVLSEDGKTATAIEGKTVNIQVVDVTKTTMSVYVDGILLDTVKPITTSDYYGGALAKDYLANGYIDDLRIKNSATQESSICYDNIVFMPISNSITAEELGIVGEDGKPVASLANSPIHNTMPKDTDPTPVISVDGVEYTDVAAANAVIKENSIVELLANIDEAIEINCAGVKFVDNGKSFPGFVSSAYKFVDWTAARGADYSVLADASEIVIITYPEYEGVSGTQTAVIGTLLKAPAEFDAVSKKLNAEAKKYQVLEGWSLSETEDVQLITAAGIAYPTVVNVDAVVVNWTTEDENTVLHTDFYFPGDATVLDEFDGEDIAIDYSQNAYYGVGRKDWSGIETATAGLATSGEYTIKAVMGKVAPKIFPGLKYNLSLYANYSMNFYVPAEIDGISNVVVSTVEDGSVSISKFEPGTLEGEAYEKFGYMLGIADTEIKTFYLVYYVGEDRITFPIYVGVPTYAATVMDMYDTDTSDKGEATKSLIVNMANYATKVLAISDIDMTVGGAKIYADIVEEYGDKYLSYFAGLTNDRFLPGEAGDLYAQHGVANLNFITGTDEKEDNAEALTYIESIGFSFNTFEPAFLIKYSDKAIEKGIQKPNSGGVTDYFTAGVHLYAGCYSPYVTSHWAEKDGVKYYGSANLWASVGEDDAIVSNGDKSYDYCVLVSNNCWNTTGTNAGRQEWYDVSLIRNNLDIQVYWSYYDSAKPEGSNNGQITETIGHVYYNLAAYINDMLEDAGTNAEFIEAAKAIYAYSYASEIYKSTN